MQDEHAHFSPSMTGIPHDYGRTRASQWLEAAERECSGERTGGKASEMENKDVAHAECRRPDKDTGEKKSMQSRSSQTPEGIVGNGGMLDGDRERREGDRARQRAEWRAESGEGSIKGEPSATRW
jgi:hypothetical protein